jgi:hypothetical protein
LRKRLIYGLVIVVALIALFMVVKSCGKKPAVRPGRKAQVGDSTPRRSRRVGADSLARKVGAAARGGAKLAASAGAKGSRGSLKGMTPEQQAAQKKQLNDEKRRLRQELRRRQREEQLAGRAARQRGARTSGRSLYDAYTLKGTVAGIYALVGNRRLERGDVVAGKKIIDIESDRIVVEQFGTDFTVLLGEPIDRGPTTGAGKR